MVFGTGAGHPTQPSENGKKISKPHRATLKGTTKIRLNTNFLDNYEIGGKVAPIEKSQSPAKKLKTTTRQNLSKHARNKDPLSR